MISRRGSCLCGAVRLEVSGDFEHAPEACHCTQCRKVSGHFLAAVNVRRDLLKVQGEDSVAWYRSSDQVRRGFCRHCGSTLFWKPDIEGYQFTAVALGVFDDPVDALIAKHTFVGDKGDYYTIDDGAEQTDAW